MGADGASESSQPRRHQGEQLKEHVRELCHALAMKADGLILLDRNSIIIFEDKLATDILAAADGLACRNGRLVVARPPDSRRLARSIEDVVSGDGPLSVDARACLLVTRPSGRRPYLLCVLPPRSLEARASHHCGCAVHIYDLARRRQPRERTLQETFGLTKREAELAVQLARLASLQSAAAAIGMATNTARNHLRGMFRKLGTESQVETVQLLSKIP